jgi:hypothetical protein
MQDAFTGDPRTQRSPAAAPQSNEIKLQAMALASKALDIAMRAMIPDPAPQAKEAQGNPDTSPYDRKLWGG